MHAEHTIYKYAVVVPGGLSSLTSVSTSDFSAAFRVANARSASRFLAASCVRTCRHVGDSSQLLASSWKAPDLRNAALWNAPPEQAHVLHCLFIVFLGICLFSLGNCHFFLDILVFQQAHALLTQSAWTDPAIAAERRMPTYQSFSEHRCFPHCFSGSHPRRWEELARFWTTSEATTGRTDSSWWFLPPLLGCTPC